MVEFNAGLMTDEDLLAAANELFQKQEQDFVKIKSEKWYQTLFHAITLNRDGQTWGTINDMYKALDRLVESEH